MKLGNKSLAGSIAIAVLVTANLANQREHQADFQLLLIESAQAAGGMVTGPNVVASDRYVYYPATEVLAEDEVRVIACGTGMPDQRRTQASACFLFEFDNCHSREGENP
jgi:ribonuclease Z